MYIKLLYTCNVYISAKWLCIYSYKMFLTANSHPHPMLSVIPRHTNPAVPAISAAILNQLFMYIYMVVIFIKSWNTLIKWLQSPFWPQIVNRVFSYVFSLATRLSAVLRDWYFRTLYDVYMIYKHDLAQTHKMKILTYISLCGCVQ